MATILNLCLGLGLSAACGFRVFVPMLVMGLAARTGYLTLSPGFAWIGETPALVTLTVATVAEIAAYYVPWLDNALDVAASPVAVVAGIVVSASVVTDIDLYLRWTLAVIAGGGAAGSIQLLTAGTRHLSTVTTAGFGNPLVATLELCGSLLLSALALLVPALAALAVVLLLVVVTRRLRLRRSAA